MSTGLFDMRGIEAHVYRAVSGNRLSARTETVDGALAALRKLERPWETGMFSRETWRRWNLAPGAKNAQRPSARHQGSLLAWMRRARLSAAREAQIRRGEVTMKLYSRYELVTRVVGPVTLGWSGSDPLVDAYLRNGAPAAARALLDAIEADHFKTWIDPANGDSTQGYDLKGLSLTESPERGANTRNSTSRRRRR